MKRLPLLIFIFFGYLNPLLFAQESGIKPARTNTSWFQNKTIKLHSKQGHLQPYQVTNGNNWVFQYTYQAAEQTEIADDEFSETVVFELTPTHRKKINQKIAKTKHAFIYLKSCYCLDAGPLAIQKGLIKGYKLNANTWHFELTIEVPNSNDATSPRKLKQIKGDFKFEAQ